MSLATPSNPSSFDCGTHDEPAEVTPALVTFEMLIEELVASPDQSLKRIAVILEQNIALKGEVIRQANSLVYSLGRPVSSLAHAIACLGYSRCRALMISHLAKATATDLPTRRTDPPQTPQERGGSLLRGPRTFRRDRLVSFYPPKNRRHESHFRSSVFEQS